MSELKGRAQQKVEIFSKQYEISVEDAKRYYLDRQAAKLEGKPKPSFHKWKENNLSLDTADLETLEQVVEEVTKDHEEALKKFANVEAVEASVEESLAVEVDETTVAYSRSDLNRMKKSDVVDILRTLGGYPGRKSKSSLVSDILSLQE
jgi:hypothetical protein